MTVPSQSLRIFDVSAGYGAADIIHAVNLTASAGLITTIAGPNGAGKSTLMKTLAGLLRPRQGTIWIGEQDVTALPPPRRAAAGLGYVPQERNVFRNLTIDENLRIGFEFIHRSSARSEFAAARGRVLDLFPDIGVRPKALAGTLSGGQRQMLALGCALVAGPSTLLLDEPSAGLSPLYVSSMLDAVAAVNRSGVTVIVIEQNVIEAMRISHEAVLLAGGEIKGRWAANEFLADPVVRSSFLGGVASKHGQSVREAVSNDASAA
jgi:ABC-type branched-subunit amino acid transport system ATPase component